MQRSSWCQCHAFCPPFRTSLDPRCPNMAKAASNLKTCWCFFGLCEEFECLNTVLVHLGTEIFPKLSSQAGNTFWFYPSPLAESKNHPVTFPTSKQPSSSVDAACTALPFPLPSLDWGSSLQAWTSTTILFNQIYLKHFETTSIIPSGFQGSPHGVLTNWKGHKQRSAVPGKHVGLNTQVLGLFVLSYHPLPSGHETVKGGHGKSVPFTDKLPIETRTFHRPLWLPSFIYMDLYGGFLKWGYPPNHPSHGIFPVPKTIRIVGYPHGELETWYLVHPHEFTGLR